MHGVFFPFSGILEDSLNGISLFFRNFAHSILHFTKDKKQQTGYGNSK
ncbi:hypothetical protein HMPREF9151_00817 [Hoylesella saccharolytica F0055]|uniref:Uncharacterized protein n=1 Tax=Hoylesella saccharolytica F0055 TaxID=1127699 RepID=L1NG75_9BACT|nr:hypothetical protein HMPREF9151_00817 [Hoylesella saccharolytica F0055]